MNGFDRSSGQNGSEADEAETDCQEPLFPHDFTPDEADFAAELQALFTVEREELPPLYVQTLLENEWHQPVPAGYEHTLVYRVFRRLNLSRGPLLPGLAKRTALPTWASLVETFAQVRTVSRVASGLVGTVVLAMLLSVVLTTPSFAEGLRILLGHTGVQQVQEYPTRVQAPGPIATTAAQPAPALKSVAWLGHTVGSYVYTGMRYEPTTEWSQGPIAHVQYRLRQPTGGTGVLDIREFRVSDKYAAVLQVVKAGSATQVTVGDTPAVYVDGGWISITGRDGDYHTWRTGTRNALIFERDGVIFWIIADQRDGTGQAALLDAAQHVQQASHSDLVPHRLSISAVSDELPMFLGDTIGDELYALVPAGTAQPAGMSSLVQMEARARLVSRS